MSVLIPAIIDQAKLVSNNRRNAAVADADWVIFINWAIESWYKFRIALDPALYFQQIDFALTGGASGSAFNLDLAFVVRLVATSLPAVVASGGPGPGRLLTASLNGLLSVDGLPVVTGDQILYTLGANAGIYTVGVPGNAGTPFVLARSASFDTLGPTEVQVGAIVTPTAGVAFANDPFILTALTGAPDVGTQTWTQNDVAGRFRSLHGLDINPDTGSRMTVTPRSFRARNETVGSWTPAVWCGNRKYDLRGAVLYITPPENAAGNYRAYYRAAPYKFATPTDSDPLDAVLEQEIEAIVLLAACNALNIEETSNDPWIKRIQAIKVETTAVYERDDGEPARIIDVEDLGWGF